MAEIHEIKIGQPIIDKNNPNSTEIQPNSDYHGPIGSLDNLTTTAKNDLVSAINEINEKGGGEGGTLSFSPPLLKEGQAVSLKYTGGLKLEDNQLTIDLAGNETMASLEDKVDGLVNKKYAIICVAGQSNAVGYDESPVDPLFYSNGIDYSRIKQLGFKGDDNLKIIPLGHCAQNYQDMSSYTNPASPDYPGTKGMHLPLAIEMLKYVPENTDILIIPCAYGGTGFNSGTAGTYDEETKKPSTNSRKWGKDTPFYQAMRDRIKYALDLNKDNVFLGVVWLQGENDKDNAATHYVNFQEMTEVFFSEMNESHPGRVKKGVWDRDLWFNIETVAYWYTQGQCQAIWDNYKRWNDKSYIAIPREAPSNEVNGTGATSSVRASHFGNNAYNKFIVPQAAKKMVELNYPSIYSSIMSSQGLEFDNTDSYGVLTSTDVNSAINEIVNKLSVEKIQAVSVVSTVSTATANASAPANNWLINKSIIIPSDSTGGKLRCICRWDISRQPTANLNFITVDVETNQILKKIESTSGTFKQDGSYGNRWFFEFEFINNSGRDILVGMQCDSAKVFNALQGRANSAYMGSASLDVGGEIPESNAPWLPEFDFVIEQSVPANFMGGYISVEKLKEVASQSMDFDQFKTAIQSL